MSFLLKSGQLVALAQRSLFTALALVITSGSAFAAGTVRNVFEFRIPPSRHAYVGDFQRDKNPIYHVGNFLIDGRVVGTWDVSQANEAQRVFRTEVMTQPGQAVTVGVHVTRTNYGPMSLSVKSKTEDTLWQVDWFTDSINVVGSKPLGPPAAATTPASGAHPAPAPTTGSQVSPPAAGGAIDGIDAIGPLRPVNFNLHRQWIVREHLGDGRVWEAAWIRRGNSNTFDATWRLGGVGNPVKDVVTVSGVYSGNIVEIRRRGNGGTYLGPLTSDKRGVARGTASWYKNELWEARFVDNVPAPPRPPVDGHGGTPDTTMPGGVSRLAGSHVASVQVYCLKGTETRVNNWVRSCVLVGNQTFNRVTFRNPGMPPTTVPVMVRSGVRAFFDEYGYLVQPTR